MKLFLGVDGGQSSTRMVLGDERGVLLAHAKGGPSNHTEEPGGPERLRAVLQAMLKEILGGVGRGGQDRLSWAAACFGMTGELAIKRQVIAPLIPAAELNVVHDSVIALEGATAGSAGIIVMAGTGSVARGRNGEGAEFCVGGWGHAFGDEGSAYWIGRESVRAVLAEWDQMGERTRLTSMLRDRLRIQSPHELIRRYYAGAFSREQLAGLAVWANEAAEAGDKVAQNIMSRAGLELGRLANALAPRLLGEAADRGSRLMAGPQVYYSGGVFNSSAVLTSFTERVRAVYPACQVSPPQLPPVLGALLLAYQASRTAVDDVLKTWPMQLKNLS